FQAEDGIRDFHVTGVQTCALPIYPGIFRSPAAFAISWAESSCAFLIASLKAACRRSSNISRSSRVSGSNVTFLTSKVPLISTTTDRKSVVQGRRIEVSGRAGHNNP